MLGQEPLPVPSDIAVTVVDPSDGSVRERGTTIVRSGTAGFGWHCGVPLAEVRSPRDPAC
jgi:hypothetical protein